MKIIYLYTTFNWYRTELFRSISRIMDCHVYILNGYSLGYESIDYTPEYADLNLTVLSGEESRFENLVKRLDQEEFDSIVVPSMNDLLYLRLTTRLSRYYSRKGKTVLYFWEYWPMEPGSYGVGKWAKQQIRHFYTRLNRKSITYFLAPSINTYSFYQRMNVPSWKLVRCYNASTVAPGGEEAGAELRKKLGIGENEKVVLYFGRVEAYKGIHELIRAFKGLDNGQWHLLIVGPGEEKIQGETAGIGNIHVLGAVRPEDRSGYYAASDLFVLGNTYRNKVEPWGLTVNEAMQFGLPVIASNATGSAEDLVFQGINGYIVNAKRLEEELQYYMRKILSDDELIGKMGQESRRIVSGYTFDNMAAAFLVSTEKGRMTTGEG